MIFAHDTERALAELVALFNTAPSEFHGEELNTVRDLDEFLRVWEWTGSRTRDRAELDGVQQVRDRLHTVWLLLGTDRGLDAAVEIINELLRDAP
ncbi:MAG TPA: ABATE domain-containing protein, partial [Mycobacteriales bacterium]|nr:ABATE domain-containing protein [Mycobacteriales bacterium]